MKVRYALRLVITTKERVMGELTDNDKKAIEEEATRKAVNAARKRLRGYGYRDHDDVTPEEAPHLFAHGD